MICKACGAELDRDSEVCPSCGAPIPQPVDEPEPSLEDEPGEDLDEELGADESDDALDEGEGEPEADLDEEPDADATVVYAPDGDETVVIGGDGVDPGDTALLGNADATAVFGEAAPGDDDEVVEYVRQGFATFMPIEQGSDEGIDVDPDELTVLEPIAMRDLDEDEAATTAIGPAYQMESEAPKSRRGLKIFLAVFIILLVAAGAACGIGYYKYKDRVAHEDVAVHVVMEVPGYPAGDDSSTIPVRVAGMDLDGNNIDERMYFEETSGDIELKRGEYQISAVGTPVTGEGTIYRYPKRSASIVVDETGVHAAGAGSGGAEEGEDTEEAEPVQQSDDGADSGATFMGEKVHLTYEQIAPERISDAMIDDAVAWMADSEVDAPKAETFRAAITKARDARLKQMEEEKKALEKQRREEELKSALAGNPAKVDSASREWAFTGVVVEFNVEHEVDGEMRYYKQYALEIPEEAEFDLVSKDDAKKLEEQKKAAEEDDGEGDDAAADEKDEAAEDGDAAAEDEDAADEPDLVDPVKSTKIIMLSSVSSGSSDTIAASPWAEYVGKTVTVKGKLSQSIADTPENEHSQIHFADDARMIKDFGVIEE
ncbi:MAG: hypothetical protein ACOYIP_00495 [Coriobacteriales bacterium]